MYREFFTPDDEEVYEATGEWPDADENGARVITFRDISGQSLKLSYDALERSVRVRWESDQGFEMADIYREGATRLSFTSGEAAKNIFIDFHMGECAGVMEIQITPHLAVKDRILFQ